MNTSEEQSQNNEEHLSKIRVIYNSNFINFIKKLKQDNDLSCLYLEDMEKILPLQEELREYIVENQHLFQIQYGKIDFTSNSHPDFFAIMICIIIPIPDLENYSNFNEIHHESKKGLWHINLYSSETQEEGFEAYVANHFKCACNHWCSPQNLYIIHNIQSKQNILIGCDCAEKTGFIEPEQIKRIKARREENPKYKKFMEMSERKNEEKYKENLENELKKLKTSKAIIENDYKYFGGNYGDHEQFFNNQKEVYRKNGIELDDINNYIFEKCIMCDHITKNKILLTNDDEIYCICERCCIYFNKMPKKHGICDDCGDTHRNRSDNYCNECREKTNCLKCRKRAFCFNSHCRECREKYHFCVGCNINEVKKQGYHCSPCYNKVKKCKCGKILKEPKYKQCWQCKNKY
jgi:hypothetical protein